MFGGGAATDVNTLIAKKNYTKAIEIIQAQLAQKKDDARLRMQLADVMGLAGRGKDAVGILLPLADDYAREGFATKAIAVLKKVEKIEPGRGDVAKRLAGLIQESRQIERPTLVRRAIAPIEMEEIGMEAPPVTTPASEPAPLPPPLPDFDTDLTPEPVLDLEAEAAEPAPESAEPEARTENVLFSAFSQEELIEVINGLELLTFESGDIILTEGEPGSSLFVLTSGFAKAFVRNPQGKHVFVRALREGDFFGEISIMTGKPRTATVTAATRCELLELDRTALDSIAQRKPRVKEVLQDFYVLRANSIKERRIRGGKSG